MKTKERLAAVLGAAGLGELSRRALLGHYDDFESPLATPIMQLVLDLEAVGAHSCGKRWKGVGTKTGADGLEPAGDEE